MPSNSSIGLKQSVPHPEGLRQGRRPELQSEGLVRSQGGWVAVDQFRRGREAYVGDERILGSSAFVKQMRRTEEAAAPSRRVGLTPDKLLPRVCRRVGITPAALAGAGRGTLVTRGRTGVAYLWCRVAGQSGRTLAAAWRISCQAVYAATRRGEAVGGEGLGKKRDTGARRAQALTTIRTVAEAGRCNVLNGIGDGVLAGLPHAPNARSHPHRRGGVIPATY